jgi:peptidoglycan L-alanyl-D-glutamate endopeptidase CwlK
MTPRDCLIGCQTKLQRGGFYHGDIDGLYGPLTERAWRDLIAALQAQPAVVTDAVDARSEGNIKTLLPQVQPYARKLVAAAAADGITIVVTSGTRTYEEQNELYEQGRSKPGNIVTNARAGYSWHNHGVALDVTVFEQGKPVWESIKYKSVGAIGKRLGFEWGGDFTSFSDEPHFQMMNGKTLAEARALHDAGRTVFS